MRTRPIIMFLLLAFGFSWGWWGIMLSQGMLVQPGSRASHLPGLMGPMIAALIVIARVEGRAGLLRLWHSATRIPRNAAFALLSIAAPVALAAVTLLVLVALGQQMPSHAAFSTYPGLPPKMSALGTVAAVAFLNGYGEEVGWRGWLLEALIPRFGKLRATALLALIWMAWHLPLFWLNASMTNLIGPMLFGWMIGLFLGAFVMSQLYLGTGRSLLAVALWHVTYNLCVATDATAGTVAAVVSTGVMLWGIGVIWRWRRDQLPQIVRT